ncbi:hypothetical protein BUALT_Bualt03G0205800 [Buddleja alternifolia]|uniref:NAC domain-containing protein n=1 Tax=Buddleja alternifolia TaxID=168488 RepID=A0AAV6XX55_9LAMI|nr:hypothetical protein BUALT_Bualt03G0205800 [Buddleja alternifolia]
MESHNQQISQPNHMPSITTYEETKNPIFDLHEQKPGIIAESPNEFPAVRTDQIVISSKDFPKGYRFNPTDEELITYYLMERIKNEPIPIPEMYDADLYQHNPTTLTGKYHSLGKDEWFFFTPRDRKYPNGTRPNRAAGSGYWKATGADKAISNDKNETIGFRKALVFYEGKPPKGCKSNWIMHEYRVNKPTKRKRNAHDMRLDDWVLCHVYLKSKKSNKKKSKKTEVDPVDQCPSEVNATPLEDNHEDNLEGVPQKNVDDVKPCDRLINNTLGDCAPQFNQNGSDKFSHQLMEIDAFLAKYDSQSNIEFQTRSHEHGEVDSFGQLGFPLQNALTYDQTLQWISMDFDAWNSATTQFDFPGSNMFYEFEKTEDVSYDVPPNDLYENQLMAKTEKCDV